MANMDSLSTWITEQMVMYGWSDIWYANPYPLGTDLTRVTVSKKKNFGKRWFVGDFTGPDGDLVCVKECQTAEEAERWLSPAGATIQEAVSLAVALVKRSGGILRHKELPEAEEK